MISVHQMGEILGVVSGFSCTQLAEFYSTEAGVSFRRCCFRMSSKTGSPMTVTRIFLSENVRVNGDWRYLSKIAAVSSS